MFICNNIKKKSGTINLQNVLSICWGVTITSLYEIHCSFLSSPGAFNSILVTYVIVRNVLLSHVVFPLNHNLMFF